jgi:hypothetical protein
MRVLLQNHPWLLALSLVVLVNLPAAWMFVLAVDKIDNTVECVSHWADETSQRTAILTEANNKVRQANDLVLRSAASGNRELIIQKLGEYVKASDEYNKILSENPIPPSPRLVC